MSNIGFPKYYTDETARLIRIHLNRNKRKRKVVRRKWLYRIKSDLISLALATLIGLTLGAFMFGIIDYFFVINY